ncbi:MAG: DUF3368 domain-containing protein [Planctomycetota bacterium]
MIVVSDASPIIALVNIRAIGVLPELFGTVAVPTAVAHELRDARRPASVRAFIEAPPEWLQIHDVGPHEPIARIHAGEDEAIALAMEIQSPLILMDDRDGRAAAVARGLDVTGTVGVLELAARRDMLDLAEAFVALKATDFYISPRVLELVLERFRAERGTY